MANKFTFKTTKSTGRYRCFYPDQHEIKINKIAVGTIGDLYPFAIILKVHKDPKVTGSCDWRWITLKKQSESLQEAKYFLNENFASINELYKIYINDPTNP